LEKASKHPTFQQMKKKWKNGYCKKVKQLSLPLISKLG